MARRIMGKVMLYQLLVYVSLGYLVTTFFPRWTSTRSQENWSRADSLRTSHSPQTVSPEQLSKAWSTSTHAKPTVRSRGARQRQHEATEAEGVGHATEVTRAWMHDGASERLATSFV